MPKYAPIEYNGETMSRRQAAYRFGLSNRLLTNRLNDGWSIEKALTTPKKAYVGWKHDVQDRKLNQQLAQSCIGESECAFI